MELLIFKILVIALDETTIQSKKKLNTNQLVMCERLRYKQRSPIPIQNYQTKIRTLKHVPIA